MNSEPLDPEPDARLGVPEPPAKLVEALARHPDRVLVLVGSGLSMGVLRQDGRPFPSWVALIDEIRQCARLEGFNFTEAQERGLDRLLGSGTSRGYLLAAGWLQKRLGNTFFLDFLRVALAAPARITSSVHEVLHRLAPRGIITFNFDSLLEASWPESEAPLVATSFDQSALASIVRGSVPRFLLKAHGTLERPETLILGHDDFRELLHKSVTYRGAMAMLFTQNTILALGCGVDDPDLDFLFDEILTVFPTIPLQLFALVPQGRYDEITRELWLTERGARLLEYTPSDASHPEVLSFLTHLARSVASVRGSATTDARQKIQASISKSELLHRRLTVENKVEAEFCTSKGLRFAQLRCSFADALVQELFAAVRVEYPGSLDRAVLVAQGGYGHGFLLKDSDADLALVHRSGDDDAIQPGLRRLNQLLNDGVAPVTKGAAVQNIDDLDDLWYEDEKTLFAYSVSRVIGGDPELHRLLRQRWTEHVRRRSPVDLAARVQQAQSKEPLGEELAEFWNTKAGSGGLRDAMCAMFCNRVCVARGAPPAFDEHEHEWSESYTLIMRLREASCLTVKHRAVPRNALAEIAGRMGLDEQTLHADIMRSRRLIRDSLTASVKRLGTLDASRETA